MYVLWKFHASFQIWTIVANLGAKEHSLYAEKIVKISKKIANASIYYNVIYMYKIDCFKEREQKFTYKLVEFDTV